LDSTKLRVFELPIESRDAAPLLQPEPSVRGWSWFAPYHDNEKIAFATDRGILGLFGINQFRNHDKALFPLLQSDYKLAESSDQLDRAQVVYAVENDFWIIANGEFQRFNFEWSSQRVVPYWPSALRLGSPLHPAQVDEAGKTIFVVTQDIARQIDLAT